MILSNSAKEAKKMANVIVILSFAVIIAGTAYNLYRSLPFLPFALGVLLFLGVNILKVFMIEQSIKKIVDTNDKKTYNYFRLQYLLRFVITGAALAAAALLDFISLWGALAGVLIFQISAYTLKSFTKDLEEQQDSTI